MKRELPLPALLLAPFFARSLTLVPHSLLLNRTETLATQARLRSSSATTLLAQNDDPVGYAGYILKNTQEKQKLMVKNLSY